MNKREVIFWLYVTVREELLPLSYYNNMMEAAIVMSDTFNWLFQTLDPKSYEILGNIPGTIF